MRIPLTARPTPGGKRIGSCWTGTGPWAPCAEPTLPCAGAPFVYVAGRGPLLAFLREGEGERILCAFNAGEEPVLCTPGLWCSAQALLGRAHLEQGEDGLTLTVPPQSGVALALGEEHTWDEGWDFQDATTD